MKDDTDSARLSPSHLSQEEEGTENKKKQLAQRDVAKRQKSVMRRTEWSIVKIVIERVINDWAHLCI